MNILFSPFTVVTGHVNTPNKDENEAKFAIKFLFENDIRNYFAFIK
jgi:hypothetical protein